jgi:hypothetical protein
MSTYTAEQYETAAHLWRRHRRGDLTGFPGTKGVEDIDFGALLDGAARMVREIERLHVRNYHLILRERERFIESPTDKHSIGVYHKFNVSRTDGSDKPGGKHDGCEYFVLDLTHDPFAKIAAAAYANACEREYPALAADMRKHYGLSEPVKVMEVIEWLTMGKHLGLVANVENVTDELARAIRDRP